MCLFLMKLPWEQHPPAPLLLLLHLVRVVELLLQQLPDLIKEKIHNTNNLSFVEIYLRGNLVCVRGTTQKALFDEACSNWAVENFFNGIWSFQQHLVCHILTKGKISAGVIIFAYWGNGIASQLGTNSRPTTKETLNEVHFCCNYFRF